MKSNTGSEVKFEINNEADLLSELFITKADEDQRQQKKDKHVSQTNIAKRVKLLNEIFNYIHFGQVPTAFFSGLIH